MVRYASILTVHRGHRAWRAREGLCAYLGGPVRSEKKKHQYGKARTSTLSQPDALLGVGLPHSSGETGESQWSEGGSIESKPQTETRLGHDPRENGNTSEWYKVQPRAEGEKRDAPR